MHEKRCSDQWVPHCDECRSASTFHITSTNSFVHETQKWKLREMKGTANAPMHQSGGSWNHNGELANTVHHTTHYPSTCKHLQLDFFCTSFIFVNQESAQCYPFFLLLLF